MNKYIKVLFVILLLVGAILWFFLNRHPGWGFVFLFLSLIPAFLLWRNEYLLLAFFELRKQNIAGAERWLNKIKNPENQLIKKQQGYYNYLMGLIYSQNQMNKAETHLKKALSLGLSMKQDRAMAKLNLAAIALSKGRKREAETLLSEAKKLDKAELLEEQIRMIRAQLKRVHLGRNLHNPQMRQRR